ncbi:MAG: response regulator, partial [Lachnospiraceae bacterium]|nr:response regulator [Lachnospiraceae bacterium]
MKQALIHLTEETEVLPCVFDAASFISTLSAQKPDLVIADLQLPGLEGFRTVEYIRYIGSQAQVVLLSDCTEFKEVRMAFRQQVADYLLRPVREEELLESVQRRVREWMNHNANRRFYGGGKFSYHKYMRLAEKEFMMSLLLGTPDFAVLDELSDQGETVYYVMTVIAGDGISFAQDQAEQMIRQVFPDEICLKLYYDSILYLLVCKSGQTASAKKDAKDRMWASSKAEAVVSFLGVKRESV